VATGFLDDVLGKEHIYRIAQTPAWCTRIAITRDNAAG